MKGYYFNFIIIACFLMTQPAYAQTGPKVKITQTGSGCTGDSLKINAGLGVTKIVWKRDATILKTISNNPILGYGITVAGDKGGNSGTDSMHLTLPIGLFVDKSGNVFTGELTNNRVQKWAPGAKYGVTVAGDKTAKSGTDSMHINDAADVYVDKNGNIYVAEYYNNRVSKWAPGLGYGVTVAGQKSGVSGSDSLHLNGPRALWVDASGNVYVTEGGNNRVTKWAPGAKYGITVAGDKNGNFGTDSMHLNYPCYLVTDKNNNLYVADQHNNRIQKWAPGAKYGITVAGFKNGTSGSDSLHLSNPTSVCLDNANNIYVGDYNTHRVKKWAVGTNYGVVVAGDKSGFSGVDSLHLYRPYRVFVDSARNIYVADAYNNRVQKWGLNPQLLLSNNIIDGTGKYFATITYANGLTINTDTFTVGATPNAHWRVIIHNGNASFIPKDLTNKNYYWHFGNGDSSTILGPSYNYTSNGLYKVILIVRNSYSCFQEFDSVISINLTGINNQQYSSEQLQVFPNPFENEISVKYNIQKSALVKIEILDVQGKTLVNLREGIQQPGDHENIMNLNRYNLKSGLYYLRMTINDQIISRKLIKLDSE
jgi:hypothetical protein